MKSSLPYVLLLLLCHLTDAFQCVQNCYNVVASNSSCTGPTEGQQAGKCLCKVEKAQHHLGCCIWSRCDDFTDPYSLLAIRCFTLHNVNVDIKTPNASVCSNTPFDTRDISSAPSDSLSTGAKAGIGIGVAVAVLAAIGISIWFIIARRRRGRPATATTLDQSTELDNEGMIYEKEETGIHEKSGENTPHEKDSSPKVELSSGHEPPQADSSQVHELPASTKFLENRLR